MLRVKTGWENPGPFEETLDHFVEEKKSEVFNLSVSLKTTITGSK